MSVKSPIRIKRVRSQPGVFVLNRKKVNKHVERASSQQRSEDMTSFDLDFSQKMEVARRGIKKYRNALLDLAQ